MRSYAVLFIRSARGQEKSNVPISINYIFILERDIINYSIPSYSSVKVNALETLRYSSYARFYLMPYAFRTIRITFYDVVTIL